ncbi:MAG: type II secretion system protein [Thermodesulfobacteriota bacterium]
MLTGKKGFTVLEVLVAVVILGLAYVAVLQNFSLALRNITRIDAKRAELLTGMLAFEELLEAADEEDEPPEGEIFMEGNTFNLVWVRDETGQFASLLMEQR